MIHVPTQKTAMTHRTGAATLITDLIFSFTLWNPRQESGDYRQDARKFNSKKEVRRAIHRALELLIQRLTIGNPEGNGVVQLQNALPPPPPNPPPEKPPPPPPPPPKPDPLELARGAET